MCVCGEATKRSALSPADSCIYVNNSLHVLGHLLKAATVDGWKGSISVVSDDPSRPSEPKDVTCN